MPKYEIKGTGKETGRKRKKVIYADSEYAARVIIESEGTLIDTIIQLPPDLPTENQLNYAKDLGIQIPLNATREDVSNLISMAVDGDKPTTERHRQFAKYFGIEVNDYIGKKAMFDLIQYRLTMPGREKELISWFTYRVYRGLVHGLENAPIEGPDDQGIQRIAEQLLNSETVIKSIRRYNGRDLIWFGEYTSPDHCLYYGGSNRTEAYKQVSSMLKDHIMPIHMSPKTINQEMHVSKQSGGCLLLVIFTILISMLIMRL